MDYMARHGAARSRPDALVPGTLRVISLRMDYLPPGARDVQSVVAEPAKAAIARYALGRDYHKVFRQRLAALGERIRAVRPGAALRPFVDSAPVLIDDRVLAVGCDDGRLYVIGDASS